MEYTLARQKHGETDNLAPPAVGLSGQGLVIISEFVSSARVMRGALNVNPWRVQEVSLFYFVCSYKSLFYQVNDLCICLQVKLALQRSLEMDDIERADRMRRNLEYSKRLTTANWATQVLNDLKCVEKSVDPDSSVAVGFGMHYKIVDLKDGFNPLDNKEVCKAYRNARHRLILLDWGGTLVADREKSDKLQAYAIATGHAARDSISEELRGVLESLTADVKNVIFVVSGKEQPAVAQYFGGIKGLGLGAEHGFYYKWPREDEHSPFGGAAAAGIGASSSSKSPAAPSGAGGGGVRGRWQTISEIGDQSWKDTAKVVMDIFVQRTYGTYIEQKGNALIWQFSGADPEFGYMQSKELVDHLALIMGPYPVEIIRGGGVSDGYIEVRPAGASKGLFLEHCLATLRAAGQEADFVLAMGDDVSDEPMFQGIAEILKDHPHLPAFAVTVGKKPTAAAAYVDDPAAVLELLASLSKCSHQEKRYFSAMDLPSQALQHERGVAGFAQAVQAEHHNHFQQFQNQNILSQQGNGAASSPAGGVSFF